MAKITLKPPTYDYLHGIFGAVFYRKMRWLGRECFLAFGGRQKMTAQKVHAAIWRVVTDELYARHGDKMGLMSAVVLEGYHGSDAHLDLRVRSEHGKFKVTSGFWWDRRHYIYSESETDEVGKSYWNLYVPPKTEMPTMVFKSPVRKSRSKTTKKIGRLIRD